MMFRLSYIQPRPCLSVLLLLVIAPVASAAGAFHPADANQDAVITQDELTAYTQAWVQHQSWPTGPNPISSAYLDRAKFIWRHGEHYREISGVPEPLGWVPAPTNGPTYVALGTATAQPFQAVAVYGATFPSNVTATFTVAGLPGTYTAAVRQDAPGQWSLIVPVNPANFEGQGTVQFQLTDVASGDLYETPPLQLQRLPAAPGSTQQFLDQAEQTLHQVVANDGYNLDTLVTADIAQVPRAARPIVFLDRMLAGPNNPYSLQAFLAGTTPGYGGTPESIDLLDRLVAASGVGTPESIPAMGSGTSRQGVGLMGPPSGSTYPVALLSSDMNWQSKTEQAIQNPNNSVDLISTISGDYSTLKSEVNALAKAAPKLGLPSLPEESGLVSAITETVQFHQLLEHYWAGVFPDRFTDMKLSIVDAPSRGYFLEDGEGNAPNGCEEAFFKANVTVKSKGFDFEKAWIEVYVPTVTVIDPGLPVPKKLAVLKLYKWIRHEYPDPTVLDTPPQTWNSDVTDPVYSALTSETFGFGYDDQQMDYWFYPKVAGAGAVTVSMISKQFGGRSISGSLNYETRPIRVVIENPVTNISGTDPITYTAELKDAFHKGPGDLAWSVSAGSIDSTKQTSDGTYQMTWKPPTEKALFPVIITAQSTTRVGLRETGLPPRQAQISVCFAGFRILPNLGCIAKGAQVHFRAATCGNETSPAVNWKIVSGPGSLTQDGLYTAPETTGTVTIEATEISHPDQQATRTFQIGCSDYLNWELAQSAFPPTEGNPDAGSGGITISPATVGTNSLGDSVFLGLYITYNSLTQPVGSEKYPTAKGHFVGAGLYLPLSPQEEETLTDDSRADVTYSYLVGGVAQPYQVHANFRLSDYNPVQLDDGPQGTQMHIHFTSDSLDSYADSTPKYPNNRVSIYWKFSTGVEFSGTNVTFTCRRDIHSFKVTVVATDQLGNSARITRTYLVVQVAGQFALPYDPSGQLLQCYYWPFSLPPPPPSGGGGTNINMVPTKDLTRCQATLTLIGARDGDVTIGGMSITGLNPTADGTRFTTSFSPGFGAGSLP